jgi:hypothetical protein
MRKLDFLWLQHKKQLERLKTIYLYFDYSKFKVFFIDWAKRNDWNKEIELAEKRNIEFTVPDIWEKDHGKEVYLDPRNGYFAKDNSAPDMFSYIWKKSDNIEQCFVAEKPEPLVDSLSRDSRKRRIYEKIMSIKPLNPSEIESNVENRKMKLEK